MKCHYLLKRNILFSDWANLALWFISVGEDLLSVGALKYILKWSVRSTTSTWLLRRGNKPATQAARRPLADPTPPTGHVHPFIKTNLCFEPMQWCYVDVIHDFECPKPVRHILFYNWKSYFQPFGRGLGKCLWRSYQDLDLMVYCLNRKKSTTRV